MKILIIAAHPDDEILGVGGTIAKHITKGDEVYVCIATKAYPPQWSEEYIEEKVEEQRRVDEVLGIKERFNLGFPTVKLNTIPHGEFNQKITEIVQKINPQVVYTHFEHDLNYDHQLIFRAVMVATRPPNKVNVLCFETLSETEWNNKPFLPNYWVNISHYLQKKIDAFLIYGSEVKDYPHPRSEEGIITLAKRRGMEACLEYAEAFKVIRSYWK
jgi:N-acetylglucosamine malate deacetylase 1